MGPHWNTIVDAETLIEHMGSADILLLDCRHALDDPEAGPAAYADGHIEGAVHAHCDRDLAGPVTETSGRHPLPDPARFRETAGRWGIGPETQVVSYDDAGGAFAARAWWLLRHYGHERVAVLDGGLSAYERANGKLTQETPNRAPVDFLGAPGRMPTVDAKSIANRIPLPSGVLLDARASERFRGEVEPIDAVAGHIPGAVNAPFSENLIADGRFKAPTELAVHYEALLGGHAADAVAVYCGSGVTAAHDVLALELAGFGGVALYPGSWSEWIRDTTRPVAQG